MAQRADRPAWHWRSGRWTRCVRGGGCDPGGLFSRRTLSREAPFARRIPHGCELRQFRIAALALCGLASTIFDFVWMRIYIPFSDMGEVATATWFTDLSTSGGYAHLCRASGLRAFEPHCCPPRRCCRRIRIIGTTSTTGFYGLHQTASFDYSCGLEDGRRSAGM